MSSYVSLKFEEKDIKYFKLWGVYQSFYMPSPSPFKIVAFAGGSEELAKASAPRLSINPDETLPSEVTLFDLATGTPLLWSEQRAILNSKES